MHTSFRVQWIRRRRRALRSKFEQAHLANLREWTSWWDTSPEMAQRGPWAGFAQDLTENPISKEKSS